jgi:hypothetical protein
MRLARPRWLESRRPSARVRRHVWFLPDSAAVAGDAGSGCPATGPWAGQILEPFHRIMIIPALT